jgi:death on curing protein
VSEPVWVQKAALLLLHAAVLAEHGGIEGLRDERLLESALARPKNLFVYEGIDSLSRLAAAYAIGISRNDPFLDGNKRASFIAMALFIAVNGSRLRADQVDATRTMLRVAAGELAEQELADWIEARPIKRSEAE